MVALDWLVLAAGLAASAWVLWYFFRAGQQPAEPPTPVAAPARDPRDGDVPAQRPEPQP
jgi:hypothetical protein